MADNKIIRLPRLRLCGVTSVVMYIGTLARRLQPRSLLLLYSGFTEIMDGLLAFTTRHDGMTIQACPLGVPYVAPYSMGKGAARSFVVHLTMSLINS